MVWDMAYILLDMGWDMVWDMAYILLDMVWDVHVLHQL
jgi:hypothetical protein